MRREYADCMHDLQGIRAYFPNIAHIVLTVVFIVHLREPHAKIVYFNGDNAFGQVENFCPKAIWRVYLESSANYCCAYWSNK